MTVGSPPYTLRQLECFVAIAEAGTIAGAADALHASGSATADALTALESALGVRLVSRHRARGVSLTSDGLSVLPIARALLAQAEEVVLSVGSSPTAVRGLVRLGAVQTLAPVVLPSLIAHLRRAHPDLRIEFTVADQPTLLDAIDVGALDVAVMLDIDVPPELSRRVLGTTAAAAVVASDHPLAGRSSIRLTELAEEPMVLLDTPTARLHTLELMSSAGVTPRIALRTPHYDLCRSLVGRGLGYSLLMWSTSPQLTADGGSVAYLPIFPSPREVEVLAVWRDSRVPARVAAVVDAAVALNQYERPSR